MFKDHPMHIVSVSIKKESGALRKIPSVERSTFFFPRKGGLVDSLSLTSTFAAHLLYMFGIK
jgi:hypothetical protein